MTVEEANHAYYDYIITHRAFIQKAWLRLQHNCLDLPLPNISQEVKLHDTSKFSAVEWAPYRDRFILKKRNVPGFEEAWEHHKTFNPHHWETWIPMVGRNNRWQSHLVHNIVDWMAMGYQMSNCAEEYYEKNKDKIIIPEDALPLFTLILSRSS
jgi:hypothetical protein